MRLSNTLLVCAAALALIACGKKDDAAAPSSPAAARATSASPLDEDFRLANAEAVDIDAFFALFAEDNPPTYESAKFDSKLGATVVTNLRFADENDGESILVKRAEFFGIDMDAIDRIKSADEAGVDAPYEKVFQKVRLLDISTEGFDSEEGHFSIGGVEFDQLSVRQGGPKSDGAGDDAARFFNAVSLGGLYFKDYAMEITTDDGTYLKMDAPDLRLVGMGGGKVDAVIGNNISYDMKQSPEALASVAQSMGPQGALLMNSPLRTFFAPDHQSVSLKSLVWNGIDLSGLMEWGLKDETPPVSERDLIDLGTMRVLDMESFIDGRRFSLVKETTVSAAEFTWLLPSKIQTDSKGGVYDFTAYATEGDETILKILKDNGLDKVKGDASMDYVWNDKSGNADLNYVSTYDGLADFTTSFGLGGIKLDALAEDAGEGAFAQNLTFRNFNLKFADETALDTLFAISALQSGVKPSELRQSAPMMIRLSGAQYAQISPRMSDYINAIADFIAEGGTLEITANPAKPVSMTEIQASAAAPDAALELLNLEITHTK